MLRTRIDDWYTTVFFRNRFFLLESIGVALLHGGIWALLFLNWSILVQEGRDFISLHYSVFSGVDFVAPWYAIFVAPAIAGCIAIGHGVWARLHVLGRPALAHLAMIGAGVIQCIVFVALWLVIRINIF